MNSEPVALGGAITGLATAVFAALVGFDIVDWSQEQIGLLLGVLTAVIATVTLVVRNKVSPTDAP